MKEILRDLPVFERRQVSISAEHFNIVSIALKRLGRPIRFALPRLRTLDILLDDDAWVVVDRALNEIPVMAWLDFAVEKRDTLHQPIRCSLNLYHAHGAMLIPRILEAVDLILGERLAALPAASGQAVVPLARSRDKQDADR